MNKYSAPAQKRLVQSVEIDVDPITVEVIGNAVLSVVEEMGETLIRAAYSTNIKERRDCSTAIFDFEGRTLAQAEHIPLHLGSLIGIVEEVRRRYPIEDVMEGDVFIGNDAYTGGGTHLPDIVMMQPVFLEGSIIAWATNVAHHADFVDRGHAHIFQEGLRIPPVRLYRQGVLQQDTLDLILLNCQVPDERRRDLQAQMAANRLGILRFQSICRKYGMAKTLAACGKLLDYAERRMRLGISSIPDGVYSFEDQFDTDELDGELTFRITIKVDGSDLYLDFDNKPPQVRASVNMVWTALLATVYYAVKAVVDPEVLPNAGLYRPIHVTAPTGTIINASAPAAVNGRTQTCQRVVDLILGALAPAVPERVVGACNGAVVASTFSGINPRTGKFYVYVETIGGGFGARATKDGLDGVHVHVSNTSNLPVEALEPEYPIMVERYELLPDSGGAGKWRGGMGIHRKLRVLDHTCHAFIYGSRKLSAPWGIFGGHDGSRCSFEFGPGVTPFRKADGFLSGGQTVSIKTPGSGGYGAPSERDPSMIERDVRQGMISVECARSEYGYVG
jgi:N-methylhydantoinase B